VVKRDEQVFVVCKFGVDEIVQILKTDDFIDSVFGCTNGCGVDVVIEVVGRSQAWQWVVDMVRKGGIVNFFGGCVMGTKVELDTIRLHYSEITLKAIFHHTPDMVRRVFALICEKKIKSIDYVIGEAPLSRLQQVLHHILDHTNKIKTTIIPGH